MMNAASLSPRSKKKGDDASNARNRRISTKKASPQPEGVGEEAGQNAGVQLEQEEKDETGNKA